MTPLAVPPHGAGVRRGTPELGVGNWELIEEGIVSKGKLWFSALAATLLIGTLWTAPAVTQSGGATTGSGTI